MKKLVVVLLFVSSLLLGASEVVNAKSTSIQLVINGMEAAPNSSPIIINDRTLVSLHSLNALDLSLRWDNINKQVTISRNNMKDYLILTVGSKEAIYGNSKIKLDVPVQLVNNRVYVPIRFISESFQSKVKWSQESRTVTITTTISEPDLDILHKESDLLKVRRLVYNLPAINLPVLGISQELADNAIYFPEGEALRYFHSWGRHIKYYEIQSNEKVLVWEAIINGVNSYSEEVGKRPVRGDEVYFLPIKFTDDVEYGKTNSEETFYGKRGEGSLLSSLILEIPDEVRTDYR